jgi:predicted nucleic acid-binding protein
MRIVLDASALVAALSDPGDEGLWAEDLLSASELLAPHSVFAEATNVLRRLESSGKLSTHEASAAARWMLQLDLQLLGFEPFAGRIWELRGNVTSYDAWYVAVAEGFDVPLATLDRKLAKAAGPRCSFLLPEGK